MEWDKKRIFTTAMACGLLGLAGSSVQAEKIIYGVAPYDDGIVGIGTDGVWVSAVNITAPGEDPAITIDGANALAKHPVTGVYYTILKVSGQTGRSLATIDPETGVAAVVGNTGDNFAGLTFNADGSVLYGISGDGANTSETLYTIDPDTAVPTFLLTLGNGSDGEGIAFNTNDGLIYHASGRDTNPAWETIDPDTLAVTTIGFNGGVTPDEIFGMGYDPGLDLFWWTNLDMDWDTVTPAGLATRIGATDGTAFPDINEYTRGLVVTASDLIVTKTNDAGGILFPGEGWTWTMRIDNQGDQDAVFADGAVILRDDLPTGSISYGPIVPGVAMGVNGPLDCSITADVLECSASGGEVRIAPAGSLNFSFAAVASAPGNYQNPTSGDVCEVDPNNVDEEMFEDNNSCADAVQVHPLSGCFIDAVVIPDGFVFSDSMTNIKSQVSITTAGSVTVDPGASLNLFAPIVELGPEWDSLDTSQLSVISDPVACE